MFWARYVKQCSGWHLLAAGAGIYFLVIATARPARADESDGPRDRIDRRAWHELRDTFDARIADRRAPDGPAFARGHGGPGDGEASDDRPRGPDERRPMARDDRPDRPPIADRRPEGPRRDDRREAFGPWRGPGPQARGERRFSEDNRPEFGRRPAPRGDDGGPRFARDDFRRGPRLPNRGGPSQLARRDFRGGPQFDRRDGRDGPALARREGRPQFDRPGDNRRGGPMPNVV